MLEEWNVNMTVKSLEDLASLNVAKYVWKCYIEENEKLVKSKIRSQTTKFAEQVSFDLEKFLDEIYNYLPGRTRDNVLNAVDLIGKELSRWKYNIHNIVNDFDHIVWTPFFTIDKVKSSCKTKNFDLTSEKLCECCFEAYVDNCRSNLSSQEVHYLRHFFGDFLDHVILYWHWYGRQNRSLMSHLHKYHVHYERMRPLENVFHLCVFLEYEIAIFYYWKKMGSHQRLKYRINIIPLLVTESEYLEFVVVDGLLPIHTFSFFWSQLNEEERVRIVKYCFLDLYRYLIYHEAGLSLINLIFDAMTPSVLSLEYYKLLRLAFDTDNLDLFVLVWQRKLARLSFEAIGNLMWNILFHKDEDFKLSVMMIKDYNQDETALILNELDKRIELVQCNFNDRIDGFLKAASLDHLRVIGFPRNPKVRNDRPARHRVFRRFHRRNL